MIKKAILLFILLASAYMTGCASVPMASTADDKAKKEFAPPSSGNAGLYIYRNSGFGAAVTKAVYLDGDLIGQTAPKTYFYKEIKPGAHKVSTQSEFGDNGLEIRAEQGRNYFVRQYIKMGLVVAGSDLVMVTEEVGKQGVLECKLAKE